MALTTEFDKAWIIECRDKNRNTSIRGGICVSKKGIILTTWLGITSDCLCGRNRGSNRWFKLQILVVKSNFNLVLLEVKKQGSEDILGFPFFNLNENVNVDLSRGDKLHGLLHRHKKPFTCLFGHSCRPLTGKMIEFPLMESVVTLSDTGDSKEEIWNSPIPYLCTKHVVEINPNMDDDDDENEYPLHFLHPDIPVIQVHGFGGGIGSEGGPVFNDNNVLIGIYYFETKCFQYILPKSLLDLFVRESMKTVGRPTKRRELGSTTDAPQSEIPRVEGQKNPQPVQTADAVLGPPFENSFDVNCAPLWRQENDALKALDGSTNLVTTSKIQLDLKSMKRRRHKGQVEARVSQLASMDFDRSRALNSHGATRKAFGEQLEKDVIAAVYERMSCAEAAAAGLNSVDTGMLNYSDGEGPSTIADTDDSSSSWCGRARHGV